MTTPAYTPQRLAWLTLRRLHGEPITYTRGDLVATCVAVPTRPAARQIDASDSVTITSRQMDWLVDPAELVDAATAESIVPRHGDRITRASGETYRVQPADTGDDVWSWSDPLHTWRRVRSEQQSTPT